MNETSIEKAIRLGLATSSTDDLFDTIERLRHMLAVGTTDTAPPQEGESGWIVEHTRYGRWFVPWDGVVQDWQEHAFTAPTNEVPGEDAVEAWFSDNIAWAEVSLYGHQLSRPDMAAVEADWLKEMSANENTVSSESESCSLLWEEAK